ncbi:hypothetical protein VOLCADRAFT_94952 [Volvox carteri f. nagariensis]|uniref:Uncharacterized protein n=1 Tax=Volvox carteri f. nagariensis TaxID=3068 RepID=D8U676_VOLCA|nr:uncharacterized protein VOLCADRAFT_94952 [Volvox carteri f. nagariensis]EFJ44805.1 hypothetical protein VOLCADRAFT_94952 [Volvox carteri f. nagariensis]|eukprot:XP_002954088.1 hypothetical protein VOLCADRAFT_94952 [Volvox carteri f. nagariensis]
MTFYSLLLNKAGVLGPRDIEAAIMDTAGDAGRALAWYPGLLMAWRFDKADTFFRDNQLPAYYGKIDSIRSVVCSFSSAAVRPCAACLALNRNHQLKRSADAASLRVAATQRVATDPSVIVPFRSAEGLERAGHVELFERLKVVTSTLITERADRIALDREIKRWTSLFQADRVRLQAYARADASRSELIRLLETSQQRGMMQCRHVCQLINPRKMMMIGPYLISFPALCTLSKHMPHVNISSQDLNYKDKQNQRATLKEALSNLELGTDWFVADLPPFTDRQHYVSNVIVQLTEMLPYRIEQMQPPRIHRPAPPSPAAAAAAALGPLAGVLVGVEGGTWYLDEMDVSSSRTHHMDRFVCRRQLGSRAGVRIQLVLFEGQAPPERCATGTYQVVLPVHVWRQVHRHVTVPQSWVQDLQQQCVGTR